MKKIVDESGFDVLVLYPWKPRARPLCVCGVVCVVFVGKRMEENQSQVSALT